MKTTARMTTIGAIAAASAALLAGPANASPNASAHHPSKQADHRHASHPAGAVFVQSGNLTGNTVVAYDRAAGGTLRQAGTYATGGLGGQLAGSVVDHPASQGSLAYDRPTICCTPSNAGSNTITVFAVRGDRLTRLQIRRLRRHFPGQHHFPRWAALRPQRPRRRLHPGLSAPGGALVKIPSWHRDLGFNPNASPEFTSTPGQIAFTPDGSKLIVTTKGDGQSIDVFPVGLLGPSRTPVVTPDPAPCRSRSPSTSGPSGDRRSRTVRAGDLLVNRDATLSLIDRAPTGQAATCWVTAAGHKLYASNAGSASVSGYTDRRGALTALGNTSTDPGTVDAAASSDGRYLYVQTGANGIVDEFAISARRRPDPRSARSPCRARSAAKASSPADLGWILRRNGSGCPVCQGFQGRFAAHPVTFGVAERPDLCGCLSCGLRSGRSCRAASRVRVLPGGGSRCGFPQGAP